MPTKAKKIKKEEVDTQSGVEDGLLPVLHDEETLRGRMGAISDEAERLRRELLTSYKALLKAEPRVHIAVTFMRDDLLASDEAKAAILDYKMKDMKPTVDGIKNLVRLELEEVETRYKLAKLEVERFDKDFEKLESQLSWHQSVLKNHGRVVPMGGVADQLYNRRTGVPLDLSDPFANSWPSGTPLEPGDFEPEPKAPTLGGPFQPQNVVVDRETALNLLADMEKDRDREIVAELEASMKEPEPVLPTPPAAVPELAPAAKAEIGSFLGMTALAQHDAVQPASVTVKFPVDPVAKTLADMITTKQLGMIRAVAREAGVDADEECAAVMNCQVTELSRRAASAMIDHLRELNEKTGFGAARVGPRDDENAKEPLFRKGPIPGGFVDSLYGGSRQQPTLSEVRVHHDPADYAEAVEPTKYREPDGTVTTDGDDELPF